MSSQIPSSFNPAKGIARWGRREPIGWQCDDTNPCSVCTGQRVLSDSTVDGMTKAPFQKWTLITQQLSRARLVPVGVGSQDVEA